MQCLPRNKQQGFTLIEVLIIAPMMLIAITLFIAALFAMTTEVSKTQTENRMVYNVQDSLDIVERDIRLTANFLAGNEFAVDAPLGYSDGSGAINSFTNNGTNGEMLILRGVTTTLNPLNPNRQLVYKDVGGCTESQKSVANFYYSNIIYFLKDDGTGGKTLWRRTLTPIATTCGTPWQKPSCNPDIVKSGRCTVDDVRLLSKVQSFTIDYLYSASDPAAETDAKDTSISVADRNGILRSVTAVRVNIATERTVSGKSVQHSGKILSSRMNIPYETVQ